MFILYLIFTLLLLLALVLLLWPIWISGKHNGSEKETTHTLSQQKEINIALYQQKLQQLDIDQENGLLAEEDSMAAKEELQQSLLMDVALTEQENEYNDLSVKVKQRLSFLFIILIPLLSISLYLNLRPNHLQILATTMIQTIPETTISNTTQANPTTPDVNKMVKKLEQRLQKDPNDTAGWLMLGRSYVVMQRIDDAIGAYKNAYLLDKDNLEIMLDYAEVLLSKEDQQTIVRQILLRALEQAPQHPDALWLIGILEYKAENLIKAQDYWSTALEVLPPDSEEYKIVQYYLGMLQQKAISKANTALSVE